MTLLRSRLSVAVLGALAATAVTGGELSLPQEIEITRVTGGLSSPVAVRHAGDARLFVVQQGGAIRIVENGALLPDPFLVVDEDSPGGFSDGGERGLLGLAFHPDYASNGRFFVYYTGYAPNDLEEGDTVVTEYRVSTADPDRADESTAQMIMTVNQDYSNHNGGDIHFGPDGYLYIGLGDGGGGGDPNNRAQTFDTLLGKMLRIDVDHDDGEQPGMCGYVSGYSIPDDNPFAGDDERCDEIWHYGLRNPYRWSFDRATGDLVIGDVGQSAWEEVSFQPAGDPGGRNYGWNDCEGFHGYDGATDLQCESGAGGRTPPVLEYGRDFGRSTTGGFVYRGPDPTLQGIYIFGDFGSRRLFAAVPDGLSPWEWGDYGEQSFNPSGFGEGADGTLYVVGYGGTLYRVGAQGPLLPMEIFANGFESS